jgi:hypothetical protein
MAIIDQILNIGGGGYGNILSSVGNIAGSAGSIIKKIKNINSKEMSVDAIRDFNTNGFLAQDSQFIPNFFARAFDEPTYLSFRIEFMFNDPEMAIRNTAYNNKGIINSAIRTAFYSQMYDYMPEPFLNDFFTRDEKGAMTPIDTSVGILYSTENYLDINLGDHGRAMLLHTFKRALKDIQENFPYYFTSLSGIDTLTSINPEEGVRVKEGVITLECMEGLDLKITQLLQLYRKIVWDDVYQRWVLPDMMRYFGMRIYVSEIRLFSDVKNEDGTVGTWDFRDAAYRNMTYNGQVDESGGGFLGLAKKDSNILTQATAVSQSFLGTKSIITKALNYASGTINTALGAYDSITGALNQLEYCNNAINEVMPTLCFECHMCEFDINDTLSHISKLNSSNKDTSSPSPKIKIKVGQVREKQSYPLNATLQAGKNGYMKTIIDRIDIDSQLEGNLINANSFGSLFRAREGKGAFLGNFLNDDALNKKYVQTGLGPRQADYLYNLNENVGQSKANTISVKRLPNEVINNSDRMNYIPGSTSQSAAKSGLFTAAMNEAVSMATHAGVSDSIVGTKSLATNPQNEQISAMQSIGEMMNAAVDRIYNGPEMKSMAAQGVSDEKRAMIANNSFEAFVRQLEKSTATSEDYNMREFLKNYRVIQNQERR